MSREGARLLNLLGFKVKGLQANIGLEQELFFVPRSGPSLPPPSPSFALIPLTSLPSLISLQQET